MTQDEFKDVLVFQVGIFLDDLLTFRQKCFLRLKLLVLDLSKNHRPSLMSDIFISAKALKIPPIVKRWNFHRSIAELLGSE